MIYASGIHESCGIPNYERKEKQTKTKDLRMHMTAQTCETNLDEFHCPDVRNVLTVSNRTVIMKHSFHNILSLYNNE